MLPGERRLAWLGIKSHLFLAAWWVFLWNFDIFKPGCDPARTDHTNTPEEHGENVQEKKREKKRKEKVWWEKFYVVNSMCPILSYWCRAGGRPRKNALFIPIYKLGVVGDEQWRRVMSELREREQSC